MKKMDVDQTQDVNEMDLKTLLRQGQNPEWQIPITMISGKLRVITRTYSVFS